MFERLELSPADKRASFLGFAGLTVGLMLLLAGPLGAHAAVPFLGLLVLLGTTAYQIFHAVNRSKRGGR